MSPLMHNLQACGVRSNNNPEYSFAPSFAELVALKGIEACVSCKTVRKSPYFCSTGAVT